MTTLEFEENWKLYGVEIDGQVKPLKNFFMMCWGPVSIVETERGVKQALPDRHNPNAPLMFDVGGEQGAPASLFRVQEEDQLVCVGIDGNEKVMGKLVRIQD